MSLKTIFNAFGDVVVSTIESNQLLKTQLGNAARQAVLWLATGLATSGYISGDHVQMIVSLAVAAGLAVYSNLKARALKRENIALVNTNPSVSPGDTLPAEAATPITTQGAIS